MSNNATILVLGANGTLGLRITTLLEQLIPDVTLITASRSLSTRHQHEHRSVDIADPSTYNKAFHGVHYIIHAAGPFSHDPTPLVSYCLDHKIHYLDIAEDPAFLNQIFKVASQYPSPQSYVIPGCSTVPGLVAVLSQRLQQQNKTERIKEIQVFLNMGSKNPVSFGLIFSLLRPLGTRLPNGEICFKKRHALRHNKKIIRYYGPYPAPFSEGITIGKQSFPLKFYVGFDRRAITYCLSLLSPFLAKLSDQNLQRLCRIVLAVSPVTRLFGTLEGRLRIQAMNKDQQIIDHIEVIADKDGLNIPASQVVWAVKKLLTGNGLNIKPGHLTLPTLITADEAINYLRQQAYTVSIHASQDATL